MTRIVLGDSALGPSPAGRELRSFLSMGRNALDRAQVPPRPGTRLRSVAAALALAAGGAASAVVAEMVGVSQPPPALAQAGGCGGDGATLLGPTVEIDRPSAGSTVSGSVSVAGQVVAGLVRPSRAELVVGGRVVASAALSASAPAPAFNLTWDSSGSAAGPTTLTVVACDAGALARGVRSVSVTVAPAAVTSTTRPSGTPGGTGPGTSVGPGPSTTRPAGGPSTTSGSTTTSRPTTTVTTVAAGPDFLSLLEEASRQGAQPEGGFAPPVSGGPPPGSQSDPVTLTEAEPDESGRGPGWPGLVVGAFGVIGLIISLAVRRGGRSGTRRGPDPTELGVALGSARRRAAADATVRARDRPRPRGPGVPGLWATARRRRQRRRARNQRRADRVVAQLDSLPSEPAHPVRPDGG
ncbi:MAG: Ig-like domain-containing protein [Acidimicrobiales bacterium]